MEFGEVAFITGATAFKKGLLSALSFLFSVLFSFTPLESVGVEESVGVPTPYKLDSFLKIV